MTNEEMMAMAQVFAQAMAQAMAQFNTPQVQAPVQAPQVPETPQAPASSGKDKYYGHSYINAGWRLAEHKIGRKLHYCIDYNGYKTQAKAILSKRILDKTLDFSQWTEVTIDYTTKAGNPGQKQRYGTTDKALAEKVLKDLLGKYPQYPTTVLDKVEADEKAKAPQTTTVDYSDFI